MCAVFADKSSSRPPIYLHIFPSPLSFPADSSPFPLAFSGHPALNNKYERVLREYPEGAISGVQARALGLTLSHTSKPTPSSPGTPLAPSSSASSMTRNANLIHLETRRAARYGKRARVPAIALWRQPPFFLLYVSSFFSFFELVGWASNQWLAWNLWKGSKDHPARRGQ